VTSVVPGNPFGIRFWIGIGIVVLIWAGAVAWYGHAQKPVSRNNGLGWDGSRYHHMYQQAKAGQRFAEDKPFVYRVAAPWLASRLGLQEARTAFHAVNLTGVLLTGCLLFAIMTVLGARPGISLFLTATFFLQWHAPLRQQFYDSFGVDAPSQPFTCLIFLLSLAMRRSPARIAWLSLATFAGVFFRESVLFAAFAVWLVEAVAAARSGAGWGPGLLRDMLRDRSVRLHAIPLFAGILGIAITHRLGEGSGPYSFVLTIVYYLYHKPMMVLIHAFYNGYGTALIPVLVFWRRAWEWIRIRPLLGIYPLITFGLGWTAGGDTTRINYWGCLALLPLMAVVLSELKLATFGIGVFLVLELITTRLFFSIPDFPGTEAWHVPLLTGWGTDLSVMDLWSELANPRVLMISLFQYAALTVFAFLWIRRVGPDRYVFKPLPMASSASQAIAEDPVRSQKTARP
jgi:hypothetical protein